MPSIVISIPALMPGDIILTSLFNATGNKLREDGAKYTHTVLVLSPTTRGETLSPDGNCICSREILTNDTDFVEHLEDAVDAVVLRPINPPSIPTKDFVRDCIIHAFADSGRPYPIQGVLESGKIKNNLAMRFLERALKQQKNSIFKGQICSAYVVGILHSAGVIVIDVREDSALRQVMPDDLSKSPLLESVPGAVLTVDVNDGSWRRVDGLQGEMFGLDSNNIHNIVAAGCTEIDAAPLDEAKDKLKEQIAERLEKHLSGEIDDVLDALWPTLAKERKLGWVK